MNLKTSTTLGIEISNDRISFAMVSEKKGILKLVKSGHTTLPSGVINNGNIVDQDVLVKTLKNLLPSWKIRLAKSIVSLPAQSSLVQIIDFPEEMPTNIRGYVGSEIKHCALFSGKSINFDYTGLKSPGAEPVSRVFISAAKKDNITQFHNALNKAGISPETIEPAVAGWMRSLYNNIIKNKQNINHLLILIRDGILNICVFRGGVLDLIRSIKIARHDSDSRVYNDKLTEEINSVFQYYEIEFASDNEKEWQIIADLSAKADKHEEIKNVLENRFHIEVSILSNTIFKSDTVVEIPHCDDGVSLTALGLALHHQKISCPGIKTDLISNELKSMRGLKNETLVYSCCIFLALMAIFIFSAMTGIRATQASENIDSSEQESVLTKMRNLNEEIKIADRKIKKLMQLNKYYEDSLSNNFEIGWADILTGISQTAPQTLQLIEIQNQEHKKLELHGISYVSKSVYSFAEELSELEAIKSAEVQSVRKNPISNLIDFSISCTLVKNHGGQNNAD